MLRKLRFAEHYYNALAGECISCTAKPYIS